MKNPPVINQNHLTENRKQTFKAEELENTVLVIWDVTLSSDMQFLPPCGPMAP
jgi:hypothetical protein